LVFTTFASNWFFILSWLASATKDGSIKLDFSPLYVISLVDTIGIAEFYGFVGFDEFDGGYD